jgi:hypothetical protein
MTQPTRAGWYPDLGGAPGTRYWDGQEWQQAAPPTGSIWVTNAMAAYSLILGFMAFLLDFK